VCDNILGVTFTNPNSLANPLNTPLYPTQLFDILINALIFITLLWMEKRKKFAGQLMLIYMMMYAVGRSINEVFRGDEERGFVFNGLLSHSQFIAVLIMGVCTFAWVRWRSLDADKL